jgi:uncharacterized protein YdaU (DUF1376 family)
MAEFPAIPLWTDAYLGDTGHLSCIEHGAYLLLLITMWRAKDQKLPNDDKMLARYCRLSGTQWQRIKPVILEFFTDNDGYLTQGRLSDEHDTVKRLRMQRSNAGTASALKRKNRAGTNVPTGSQRKSAPTPTPTKPPLSPLPDSKGAQIDPLWQPDENLLKWCRENGVSDPVAITAKFVDYWQGIPGQKGRKRDWSATFRNWCRKEREFKGAPSPTDTNRWKDPATLQREGRIAHFNATGQWDYSWGPEPQRQLKGPNQ